MSREKNKIETNIIPFIALSLDDDFQLEIM